MTWDATVYQYAQRFADQYSCSGNLQHSGGKYGENLAVGYADGAAALQAWYEEAGKDGLSYSYGSSSVYNHFTQVVWKSTTKLGCVTRIVVLKTGDYTLFVPTTQLVTLWVLIQRLVNLIWLKMS